MSLSLVPLRSCIYKLVPFYSCLSCTLDVEEPAAVAAACGWWSPAGAAQVQPRQKPAAAVLLRYSLPAEQPEQPDFQPTLQQRQQAITPPITFWNSLAVRSPLICVGKSIRAGSNSPAHQLPALAAAAACSPLTAANPSTASAAGQHAAAALSPQPLRPSGHGLGSRGLPRASLPPPAITSSGCGGPGHASPRPLPRPRGCRSCSVGQSCGHSSFWPAW